MKLFIFYRIIATMICMSIFFSISKAQPLATTNLSLSNKEKRYLFR